MEFTVTRNGSDTRIALSGQMTFVDNAKFRQILELLDNKELKSITLEFSGVDFIDSAGLGMLLLFRDECVTRNIEVALESPQGQVEKIFKISMFDQLFTMRK